MISQFWPITYEQLPYIFDFFLFEGFGTTLMPGMLTINLWFVVYWKFFVTLKVHLLWTIRFERWLIFDSKCFPHVWFCWLGLSHSSLDWSGQDRVRLSSMIAITFDFSSFWIKPLLVWTFAVPNVLLAATRLIKVVVRYFFKSGQPIGFIGNIGYIYIYM